MIKIILVFEKSADNVDVMRLRVLTIQNFQAHKDLRIAFAPGVTTIKGPTDAGKSAILRALRWLCLNDIGGDEFVSDGQKQCNVSLAVDEKDEKPIIRRVRSRGGSTNAYELASDVDHCSVLKAFGTGVPDVVSSILRVSPINFQGQHDSPFWFGETSGEVSRQLNAVIDLGLIDQSLSAADRSLREARERTLILQEQGDKLESERAQLEPQRNRVEEFESLRQKRKAYRDLFRKWEPLGNLIEKIKNSDVDDLSRRAGDCREKLRLAGIWRNKTLQSEQLETLIAKIRESQENIKAVPDFAPVEKAYLRWKKLDSNYFYIESLIQKINTQQMTVAAREATSKKRHEDFHSQTKDRTCPTCGQKIN